MFASTTRLDLSDHGLRGLFIKPIILVTELRGFEQAGLSPVIDVPPGAVQQSGGLPNRKPSLLAQSLSAAFEFMSASQLVNDPEVERTTSARTPATLVEAVSDLSLGVFLQEAVNFGDNLRLGFAQRPAGLGQWQPQFPRRSAFETNLHEHILFTPQRNVFHEQTRHAFAVAIQGFGIKP